MRVSATAKYLRGSTRKANLVVAAIKGRPVEEAANLLGLSSHRTCVRLRQTLEPSFAPLDSET